MLFPFTKAWGVQRLQPYMETLQMRGKGVKIVRRELRALLHMGPFEWPLRRIMVYKYKEDDGTKYWKIIVRLLTCEVHFFKTETNLRLATRDSHGKSTDLQMRNHRLH